jgi:WhiB family redox-sensing transcriptional regulator
MITSPARVASVGGQRGDWRHEAACRGRDPELFFPDSATTAAVRVQIAAAKQVCRRCPVSVTCLSWALASGQQAGIWGGTTEQERHRLSQRLRASGAIGERKDR